VAEQTNSRRPGRPKGSGAARGYALGRDEPLDSLAPTAQNILKAAREILVQDGFAAMTLAGIAERAGEAKASIGYYFGNKDGLIVALVDSLVHEQNRAVVTESRHYPMGEQRVRALAKREMKIVDDVEAFVAFLEILPATLRNPSLRERVAELYRGYRETVLTVLDAAEGPDRERLAGFSALMIAVVDGLSLQRVLDPDRFDLRDATNTWELLMRLLLRELRLLDIA
jgi:AcrR family transcriptional regulator